MRVEDVFVRPDPKTGKIRAQVNVRNTRQKMVRGRLQLSVAPAATGTTLVVARAEHELRPGDTKVEAEVQVESPQLWDLGSPYLYRLTVQLRTEDGISSDETSLRCGFRDFRVVNGYFRLNGKRIFLRSTHTGNYCAAGQAVPPHATPDLLRRDMFYAKASGFNTIRFLNNLALPYQLDLCDEIGLMIYEESPVSWGMPDTPRLKERYESALREVILRDRNHPCVTIWGLLNETQDGAVFREAVSALAVVRSLDDTRAVQAEEQFLNRLLEHRCSARERAV